MAEDKPSWLKNAKVKKQNKPSVTAPRILNTKKVKETLDEAGLTIIVDDKNPQQIIDSEIDPSEEFDIVAGWSEGRVLSRSGREQRIGFVNEYMKDFNGVAACVRIGCKEPVVMWRRMSRCAYVQRLVCKRLEEWEASSIVTRDKLCAVLWREANDFVYGTAATRTTAATKLGKLMGYEVDLVNVNHNTSIEFVEKALTEEEFKTMKQSFDEEF